MDRRSTLRLLYKTKPDTRQAVEKMVTVAAPPLTGLEPYTGVWTYQQAAHLLKRATFGPANAMIQNAVTNGMVSTVDDLLSALPLPDPPLVASDDDAEVPFGQTWINAPYSDQSQRAIRRQSLRAWTFGLLLNDTQTIRQKMTLFWHNHFVVQMSVVGDPKFIYKYIAALQEHCLGNFRDLVKLITIDPSMLRYLNGNDNTAVAPNENYARELLELFTIGKGELAGPGDYTTYTETDVAEMARVLTGWRDIGHYAQEVVPVGSVFVPFRHDTGTKQLSHRFNNVIIQNAGDQEYANLIDIIFQQDEVARFICRKLYRWFVLPTIDDTTEANMIEPMAQLLISNNFEIEPVLDAVLKSAHFYDSEVIGCIIKDPIDYVTSIFNQFEIDIPTDLALQYRIWGLIQRLQPPMQMEYYEPPNVAGWKAFYQEPGFDEIWINSVTLPLRMELAEAAVHQGYRIMGTEIIIDALAFLASIGNPSDVNALIQEFVQILFAQGISQNQVDFLKEILIPGLPDFEWTVEYLQYIANPGDEMLAEGIRMKIRNLLAAMMTMPEYHLH